MQFNIALEKLRSQLNWLVNASTNQERKEKFFHQAFGMVSIFDTLFPEYHDTLNSVWNEYQEKFYNIKF